MRTNAFTHTMSKRLFIACENTMCGDQSVDTIVFMRINRLSEYSSWPIYRKRGHPSLSGGSWGHCPTLEISPEGELAMELVQFFHSITG